MSPQVCKHKLGYTSKCDIWSCGVIAYKLLSGLDLFEAYTQDGLYNKMIEGKVTFDDPAWKTVSPNAIDFVKKLLTYKEEERPTAGEALQHPWIKENASITPETIAILDALDDLKVGKADNLLKHKCYGHICHSVLKTHEK